MLFSLSLQAINVKPRAIANTYFLESIKPPTVHHRTAKVVAIRTHYLCAETRTRT
jgi:hypothetical protein